VQHYAVEETAESDADHDCRPDDARCAAIHAHEVPVPPVVTFIPQGDARRMGSERVAPTAHARNLLRPPAHDLPRKCRSGVGRTVLNT
jgi:hypothetical protein